MNFYVRGASGRYYVEYDEGGERVRKSIGLYGNDTHSAEYIAEVEEFYRALDSKGMLGAWFRAVDEVHSLRNHSDAELKKWGIDRQPKSIISRAINEIISSTLNPHDVGYVYLTEAWGAGRFKVGTTMNPGQRVAALDTGCPFDLKIHAVVRGGAAMERRLHSLLKPWSVRREWFFVDKSTSVLLNVASDIYRIQQAEEMKRVFSVIAGIRGAAADGLLTVAGQAEIA